MAVSKQPSITPETSSGEGLDEEPSSRGEAKWKRFHPFRVVRKIFRRRVKREGTAVGSDASKKSWSTSELQSVQDDGSGKCEVTSPLKIGLSVSHDSIFSPENSSNAANSEELNVPRGSSLSVRHTSMKNMFKDELFTRVRARRDSDDDDDDDEDIGLPHSPCTSPTTADVLAQGLKEKSSKSQTTCSAGSLISMGSSENDEDSAGQSSGHSSRMSLLDRRSLDSEGDLDLSQPVPLNHNAAHHKIAVRPKRTYNLPRRRMNQIAASKVTALPSTPEVVEDHGKVFQKFEVTDEVKTSSDMLISSVSETVTSTEKQISSYMTSSFSFGELSRKSSESSVQQMKEKSQSETSTQLSRITAKDESKPSVQEFTKKFEISSAVKGAQEHKNEEAFKLHETEESTNKNTADLPGDIKNNILERNEEEVIESVKLIKSSLQENVKSDSTHIEDSALKQAETSISVSSLVKSIEKADSFKSANKIKKSLEETKSNVKGLVHMQTDFIESKTDENSLQGTADVKPESELKNEDKLNAHITHGKNNELSNFEKSEEQKLSRDCIGEGLKKNPVSEVLDIESEFILKPPRKLDSDSNLAHKDASSEKQKDNSLISSLYFEEESIMSNKSLSLGMEESRIFISHHTSDNDDLKDILVTEAHNFSAIEEKVGVSVQTSGERVADIKKENVEPFISSVGISTSTFTTTDVTVNSSTSTLCDSRMMEDKITISVNSKPDTKSKTSDKDDIKQNASESQKHSGPLNAKVNQKNMVKEKQTIKQIQKSHLPDVSPNAAAVKNGTAQKRVSVEIVPFSQRMKERKYQPISFNNKEISSDSNKKSSNASVERKLSDRKLSAKNKEVEKSNNRHSFSGTLSSESKKESENVIGKKVIKPEKLQYPVQIRIHKSVPKPEIKDKLANDIHNHKDFKTSPNKDVASDVKFQMHSAKLSQSDSKFPKEEKKVNESTSKWEIKIQPSAAHTHVSSQHANQEDSFSTPQTNSLIKSESHKSQFHGSESKDLHLNPDVESPVTKGQENSWRPVKETAPILSDDPEPELLRVFARRSIKQKHCDKGKTDENEEKLTNDSSSNNPPLGEKSEENNEMISISHNSTVIKISEISKPHISKPDLKKKSKSFCEKEKSAPRSISPLKEMNLIRRESPTKLLTLDSSICNETVHPRQRLVNVSDVPVTLPPDTDRKSVIRSSQNESSAESSPAPSVKEEHMHRASSISSPSPTTSVNGSLTGLGMVKENQELLSSKEAHAPAWLQLAQQRRELREQRERLLLGGSPNSFMDASNKPARSSKVWDMVNNFQKLQMT